MKYRIKVLLMSFVIAFPCLNTPKPHFAHADPYPEDKYPVTDDLVKQKVAPPKNALQIDDYMLALAKAGHVNFIADVTPLPKEEKVQPFPATPMAKYYHWEPKLYLAILDFTQQCRLSNLWYDPSTFLFWKEPDAVGLARQWVAESDPNPNEKLPDFIDLYNTVTKGRDLLKDFPTEGKTFDISLSDLPLEQRDQSLAIIRQLFISRDVWDRAWFSDAFWDSATIRLSTGRPFGKPVSVLQIQGNYLQTPLGSNIIGLQAQEKTAVKPVH